MLRPRAKTKPSSSSQNSGPTSDEDSSTGDGKRTNHGTTIVLLVLLAVLLITISAYTGRYYWWYDSSSKATEGNNNITSRVGSRQQSNHLRVAGGDENDGGGGGGDHPVVAPNPAETLVLTTSVGVLRILLRPDLSPESVDYIRNVVADGHCSPCNLYRVEKPGILQGILKHPHLAIPTVKGQCPHDAVNIPNQCPPHDASCGCHGGLNIPCGGRFNRMTP
jgi:hypothetical protein